MVHEPVQRVAVAAPDGHVQGIERKVGAHRRVESAPHDSPGEDIGHKGEGDHGRAGRDIGDVSHPQCGRPIRGEPAFDQVCGPLGGGAARVVQGRVPPRRAPSSPSARMSRSSVHRATATPFPVELTPYLPRPVHFVVLLPDAADLEEKVLIPHRAGRRCPVLRRIVRERSEPRHPADRLDPAPFFSVVVDEIGYRGGRGSSSRAKNADTAFRTSSARCGSRLCRSRSAIRTASTVAVPAQAPLTDLGSAHPQSRHRRMHTQPLNDSRDRGVSWPEQLPPPDRTRPGLVRGRPLPARSRLLVRRVPRVAIQ